MGAQETIGDVDEVRQQLGRVLAPERIDAMPGGTQLALPGSQQLLVTVSSEHGISLLERPLVPPPYGQEFVFHVKHTPVE